MKNKKIKFGENSRLIIQEKVGEKIVKDIFGETREVEVIKEYIAKDEINLGSLKNPNKKIVHVKYRLNLPTGKK